MAATPFKVISWSPNETITDEKLDAMVSNDNWLKQNMVLGRYSAHGITRVEGIRISSGLALITARRAATASVNVGFGGFFSDGCKPIVTTATVATSQRRLITTIDGPGTRSTPTREGFQIHVFADADKKQDRKITKNLYVSWIALGY